MRPAVVVLCMLAGCGRIGIEPLADATTTINPDAAPVLCEVDGTTCDDGNICSAASSCTAGICKPVATAPTSCTVARSEPEYDTSQGSAGWFYGFYNMSTDTDGAYQAATDFEPAALFSGDLWRPQSFEEDPSPSFTWAYMARWGGHPGSFPERRASIRRWVSDVTGAATVIIATAKADFGGDGVRATLVVGGVTAFTRTINGDDADGFTESIPVDLALGTTVDLLLDPVGSDSVDTTSQTMTIESR